jgi:hypothetical protein
MTPALKELSDVILFLVIQQISIRFVCRVVENAYDRRSNLMAVLRRDSKQQPSSARAVGLERRVVRVAQQPSEPGIDAATLFGDGEYVS